MRTLLILAIGLLAFTAAPATAQTPKAGTVFRDCPDCPEMVVIPPGIFIMGLNPKEAREGPAHRRNVPKPFAIGKYEITFDEWEMCMREKGCTTEPHDHEWGKGRRPVVNINFEDALQFIGWLSKKTGKPYRLPTEAEWEYADRAGTGTDYWLGDDVGNNKANCKDCGSEWSAWGTAPVGSFPPNPFGIHDTIANAFEWVQDCWNPDHKGAPPDTRARTDGNCQERVIRGGSFYYFKKVSRSSYRAKNLAVVKSYWLGFRIARDLP